MNQRVEVLAKTIHSPFQAVTATIQLSVIHRSLVRLRLGEPELLPTFLLSIDAQVRERLNEKTVEVAHFYKCVTNTTSGTERTVKAAC
ncbi:hypothetical protein T4B_7606 [Trichinella pseudospiralis]|uniref:Uncharacterized protein n=1 Tax=Trichinella pseudospiralis TaxID=6337 RepID=A0A0V1H156_TRIPS|nr:hypothetical protein T4B_7606 [Trichinella pseudospiralis]